MDDFSLILVAFLLGALLAFLLQNSSFLSPPPKAVFIPNGPSSGEYKMVFLIRTDLQMSKGKVAAQCCHACLSAYQTALKGSAAQQSWVREWESIGQAKITLKVDSEKEM